MLKGSSGHFVIGFLVFLKSGSKILLPESVGINSGYSVNQSWKATHLESQHGVFLDYAVKNSQEG